MTGPHVFATATGQDFAPAFAHGYFARHGDRPPEIRARTLILVNTARAGLLIERALADCAPTAGPLPRIRTIPDMAEDAGLAPDLPPPVLAIRRRLRLIRLVETFLTAREAAGEPLAPPTAAPDLAEALALLIDQFHDAGLPADRLDRVLDGSGLAEKAAQHWQQTLDFVDLIRRVWPEILAEEEGGAMDPRARQRAVIEALASRWAEAPPPAPVIVAASTGSVAATAHLMAAVARLPDGAVVLPGLDPETDPGIWPAVGPDHPMGPFRNVLDALGMTPPDVRHWHEAAPHPRRILLAQALRPAPVTDAWHREGPALAADARAATADLTLIEAETQRQEAEAIALAVREALETPHRTVSVITPDAALARRITAALTRFAIVPDDIMGQPLAQSPPGVLTRLVLDVAAGPADPVAIAGLLAHPMVRPGMARGAHLSLARVYERQVLRAGPGRGDALLPGWPEEPDAPAPPEGGQDWLDAVTGCIAPLAGAIRDGGTLGALTGALIAALEGLTNAGGADPDPGTAGGARVWTEDDGAALRGFLDGLVTHADALGAAPVMDYPALLLGLMRDVSLPSRPREPHPRVALRGPREARLEDADLTILAGLNDGAWPAAPDPGPWLSRPMVEALGLALPERTVGLSAHDFQNAASRGAVILSRALRTDGDPAVASRWLIRLETLLTGIGAEDAWTAMRARGGQYLALAGQLDRPAAESPRAPRPAPIVPVEAFPETLSVTEIDRLIRDAYAVYARRVLGLRPLDPLGRPADARERGTVLHAVLEAFQRRTTPWPGIDAAREILSETADAVLATKVPWPDLRRTWRARIRRVADWFLEAEDARRATATPLGAEISGAMTFDLAHGALTLNAKADRIDRTPTGAAIYDYKTGTPPTADQASAGFSHQIHLQAAILAGGGFEGIAALDADRGAFIGLTGSGEGGKETVIELDPTSIAEHRAKVHALLQAYADGAPWLSHGRPFRTQYAGDYDHLARVGEWEAEA